MKEHRPGDKLVLKANVSDNKIEVIWMLPLLALRPGFPLLLLTALLPLYYLRFFSTCETRLIFLTTGSYGSNSRRFGYCRSGIGLKAAAGGPAISRKGSLPMRYESEVAVIIPAINEQESIAKVLAAIPHWVDDVVVVDNGSTDETAARARNGGARVVHEPRRGYGAACLAGLKALDNPEIVVFLDGDYSDHPEEMPLLVDPILHDEADLVAGSRVLGPREPGALTSQARFGNWLACLLMRLFWKVRYTDLGPFRAVRLSALAGLGMCDRGYGWMVEMQIKATQAGLRVREIPVQYRRRIGKSKVSGTIRGIVGAGSKTLFKIFQAGFSFLPVERAISTHERVIVFSRFPVPGQTKTRLIPALGPDGAADLQKHMTEHTLSRVRRLYIRQGCSVEVRYDGADCRTVRDWLGDDLILRHQGGGDLGRRMTRALRDAFQAGMQRVVVVGTDCPGLTTGHLKEALACLEKHTAVIGPANDGGYYLFGLNRYIPELFEGVDWGTAQVLEQTLAQASRLGIDWKLLPALDDIDRPEDLAIWERESGRGAQEPMSPDASIKNAS